MFHVELLTGGTTPLKNMYALVGERGVWVSRNLSVLYGHRFFWCHLGNTFLIRAGSIKTDEFNIDVPKLEGLPLLQRWFPLKRFLVLLKQKATKSSMSGESSK